MAKKAAKPASNHAKVSAFPWPKSLLDNDPSKSYKVHTETILKDQIYVIHGFLPAKICNDLVQTIVKTDADDSHTFKMETTPLTKRRDYAARVNDRGAVEDTGICNYLWHQLEPLIESDPDLSQFKSAFGLNPNIRMYRYTPGQFFDQHYDEAVRCKVGSTACTTRWTLLLYLSECQGGQTMFYEDGGKSYEVQPTNGSVLLHKHGEDCLLHEGREVTGGEKWILRSDVAWKS